MKCPDGACDLCRVVDLRRHRGRFVALLVIALLVITCLIGGCARTVQPVAIVAWPVAPKREACDLPSLPANTVVVGWPDGDRIYVTKTDLADLLYQQGAMHVWAEAVSRCFAEMK